MEQLALDWLNLDVLNNRDSISILFKISILNQLNIFYVIKFIYYLALLFYHTFFVYFQRINIDDISGLYAIVNAFTHFLFSLIITK